MSNFSAEIIFWTILQLWLNENVWNYYIHQKECVGLTVNKKNWYALISWNTLYLFLYSQFDIQIFRISGNGGEAYIGGLGILLGDMTTR